MVNGLRAILDDGGGRKEAEALGVPFGTTAAILIKAHRRHPHDYPRQAVIQLVADLLATGMRLPFGDGNQVFTWAYRVDLLPDDDPKGDLRTQLLE